MNATHPIPSAETVISRLSGRYEVDPETGCHNFTGSLSESGYGRVMINGHRWRTSRLMAYVHHGLDLSDSSQLACHHCDNPRCMNPDHIYVGTPATNHDDMVRRGRRVGRRKLTPKEVQEVRRDLERGMSGVDAAAKYGVSTSTISGIRTGRFWDFVPAAFCFVCERDTTPPKSGICDQQCHTTNADHEMADRYTREGDHR